MDIPRRALALLYFDALPRGVTQILAMVAIVSPYEYRAARIATRWWALAIVLTLIYLLGVCK